MSNSSQSWLSNIISSSKTEQPARHLRVSIEKNKVRVVDLSMPARSARWVIELIPEDIVAKIRETGVPLDEIQERLKSSTVLRPQKLFSLIEEHRTVEVWLE